MWRAVESGLGGSGAISEKEIERHWSSFYRDLLETIVKGGVIHTVLDSQSTKLTLKSDMKNKYSDELLSSC